MTAAVAEPRENVTEEQLTDSGWWADYPSHKPNPAQLRAHQCAADEVLYGGAWGGGKTDWGIAEVLRVMLTWPGSSGLILRRNRPQLVQPGGIYPRLRDRLPRWLGSWSGPLFTFKNGSRLLLGHLNAGDKDLENYLGGEFQVIFIDQAEQFLGEWMIKLAGRLRSSGELRDRMDEAGYRGRLLLSANPGGTSHEWLKKRYIDPWPKGGLVFAPPPSDTEPNPRTRAFIPATVMDNLDNIGEDYKANLDRMDEVDRRAAYGDWSVLRGARFRSFSSLTHVVDPEEWPVPLGAGVPRVLGVDYGMEHPFAAIWIAKIENDGDGIEISEGGMLVVYREVMLSGLTAAQQAALILQSEHPEERGPGRPVPTYLSPDAWQRDKNTITPPRRSGRNVAGHRDDDTPPPNSVAWHYWRAGIRARRADNRRVVGVQTIADRLRVREDGMPRLLIHSTCPGLASILPRLVRDEKQVEDVKKIDGDDAYDAFRYGLMGIELKRYVNPGTQAEDARERQLREVQRRKAPPRGPAAGLRTKAF